jgi:hypothetical protein
MKRLRYSLCILVTAAFLGCSTMPTAGYYSKAYCDAAALRDASGENRARLELAAANYRRENVESAAFSPLPLYHSTCDSPVYYAPIQDTSSFHNGTIVDTSTGNHYNYSIARTGYGTVSVSPGLPSPQRDNRPSVVIRR